MTSRISTNWAICWLDIIGEVTLCEIITDLVTVFMTGISQTLCSRFIECYSEQNMSLRLFLQALQKTELYHIMKRKGGKEKEGKLLNSMKPAKKLQQKYIPEECELIINVNKKGACQFDIVSKIESLCEDQTTTCTDVNGEVGSVNLHVNGTDTAITDSVYTGNSKDLGDIPPTSKCVALDCEFVEVQGNVSAVGRCSIINYEGEVICDIYAQPVKKIISYRTRWSGITRTHMKRAIPLECALSQISDVIRDKIVIGHGIHNDFSVLGFSHPRHLTRDTQKSEHLLAKMKMQFDGKRLVALRTMADKLLGKTIQTGAHCSVVDATTCMELYKLVRNEWETSLLKNSSVPVDGNGHEDLTDSINESMDTKQENVAQHLPDHIDKMLTSTHRILNGKVGKAKKRNKKWRSVRPHFGQLISGNKPLSDYFKEDETLQLKQKNKFFVHHQNGKYSKTNNRASSSNKVTDQGQHVTDTTGSVLLRDGKTYPCVTTKYAQTIKYLFHDQFWEDVTPEIN